MFLCLAGGGDLLLAGFVVDGVDDFTLRDGLLFADVVIDVRLSTARAKRAIREG